MEYILSKKYDTPELQALIMGPNPVKLEEELLHGSRIAPGAVVCDLGSGTGLTSVFMAKPNSSRLNWNDGSGGRARLMFPKLSTTHPMCGSSVSDS